MTQIMSDTFSDFTPHCGAHVLINSITYFQFAIHLRQASECNAVQHTLTAAYSKFHAFQVTTVIANHSGVKSEDEKVASYL